MSHEYIRYVPAIGMYAFSRGRDSCRWKTTWCAEYCFANKFYRMGWSKDEYDKADNDFWHGCESHEFVDAVKEATNWDPVPRFRFAVRGEIWMKTSDVDKVGLIMLQMPDTLFWIPTRAWQDREMANTIERFVLPLPNARVMASCDPTTTKDTMNTLNRLGWSIVFAGDNEDSNQLLLNGDGLEEKATFGMHRCEKTWDERKGACATCAEGCFRDRGEGPVRVHLKKHR
jgi:hypothetical protein